MLPIINQHFINIFHGVWLYGIRLCHTVCSFMIMLQNYNFDLDFANPLNFSCAKIQINVNVNNA